MQYAVLGVTCVLLHVEFACFHVQHILHFKWTVFDAIYSFQQLLRRASAKLLHGKYYL